MYIIFFKPYFCSCVYFVYYYFYQLFSPLLFSEIRSVPAAPHCVPGACANPTVYEASFLDCIQTIFHLAGVILPPCSPNKDLCPLLGDSGHEADFGAGHVGQGCPNPNQDTGAERHMRAYKGIGTVLRNLGCPGNLGAHSLPITDLYLTPKPQTAQVQRKPWPQQGAREVKFVSIPAPPSCLHAARPAHSWLLRGVLLGRRHFPIDSSSHFSSENLAITWVF